ncbi:MAG TPA: PepSY domain-containing protein [Idiomarina sp.]|nr:PepSY domain-containing protein [Idiomarina sp.]
MLLMAISGSLLLFKNELLTLFYPQLYLQQPVSVTEAARIADSFSSGYALMPTPDRPWFEVVNADKTHFYYSAAGELLLERPYLGDFVSWLVELHHHLALNDLGKDILGVLGLSSLLLVFTGLIRWWPRRGSFKRALTIRWANPFSLRGMQTLWQLHRCVGALLFIPIVIVLVTGTAVMYAAPVKSALTYLLPFQPQVKEQSLPRQPLNNWSQRLAIVPDVLPAAEARLLYLENPQIRAKHDAEWHPNGRNYIQFSEQGTVNNVIDERATPLGNQVSNMIYPTHVAAVGGSFYLIVVLLSGVALILLPTTGIWFYVKRFSKRSTTR